MPRFIDQFDSCPVRTVEDVAEFNKEHKDKAMPAREIPSIQSKVILFHAFLTTFLAYNEQNDLEKSLGSDETVEHIRSLKEGLRRTAKKILDNAFASQGVNLIVAPGDSSLCIHAAASGTPLSSSTLVCALSANAMQATLLPQCPSADLTTTAVRLVCAL